VNSIRLVIFSSLFNTNKNRDKSHGFFMTLSWKEVTGGTSLWKEYVAFLYYNIQHDFQTKQTKEQ
jgi:hypothetical protein